MFTTSSRGCSKEADCTDGTGAVYDGTDTTILGGTRITTQCCPAHKFDDDDAIAIDLGDICNSGRAVRADLVLVLGTLAVVGAVVVMG